MAAGLPTAAVPVVQVTVQQHFGVVLDSDQVRDLREALAAFLASSAPE